MNLQVEKIWWILPLIALFLVMPPVGALDEDTTSSVIAAEGISLSVDFGNGTLLEIDDLNGSTVLDVTSEVLTVELQWYGPLAYIRAIEGIASEGQNGWQYWVNGEFASIAVNLFSLENGDTVEWVYSGPVSQSQNDPSLLPGALIVSISGLGFIAVVYIQTSRRLQ
jgi:hypothetical protein